MSHPIEVSHDGNGAVATVVLNRPDKLNAMDLAMWRGLAEAFAALGGEERLRCVVLRGAGERAFAAGADIGEFDTVRATPAQAKEYDEVMRAALAAVRDCPVPVVAMVHGGCIGGGLELAAQCDLRLAGESARFGVPIARIGVVMAYPELEGIRRLCGPATLLEMLLEARILDAAEALARGLVNRVVPDEALAGEAEATARRIAAGAPLAHRWHRRFVRRLTERPEPVTAAELDECYRFLDTEDYREGIAAFREKRKPGFAGR